MSLGAELRAFADRLTALYQRGGVFDLRSLRRKLRDDPAFADEWRQIWKEVALRDGGKLSLGTLGVLVGASFGGVGVAALGGAVGLPLALVLGLGGFLSGAEVDAVRSRGDATRLELLLPADLEARITRAARESGTTREQVVLDILAVALEGDS